MTVQDVRISELIRPTPKQRECFQSTDQYRFTLYGGAAGGGKSYMLRWWCLRQLLNMYAQTGIKGLVVGLFSLDYPTLQDRQISKIAKEFPDWLGVLKRTEKEGFNYFIREEFGGGRIALRNLSDPGSYKSAEFAAIALEEVTENRRNVLEDLILFRLRTPGIERPAFLGATNPTGVGLQWVKQLWIDRKFPPELQAIKHEFHYVPALIGDNPHLTTEYAEGLKGLPEKKRKALLEGDWTVPEGQYFTNFERSERAVHQSVIAQIVKPWWPRWISQDWGFKHHSPVHWHTTGDVMPDEARLLGRNWDTPRKCVFTYREHVVSLSEEQQSEEQWAQEVVRLNEGESIKRYFLSSDAFGQKTSANTPAEIFSRVMRKAAMPSPEPANMQPGSRVSGWRFMYTLIQNDSWFISEMCPLALDAIPALEYDSDKGGEDVRKTDSIYDDIGDELRYGLSDMLNTASKPFAVHREEVVQRAYQEAGPTAAYVADQMVLKQRKGKPVWRGRYS